MSPPTKSWKTASSISMPTTFWPIDPDTGVETDFFGLPLMLCAGAAVLGCKNRKKEEDE